jgi:catechol 2,3-dioxygenase-like lactoylglutathione lyase family enzyme
MRIKRFPYVTLWALRFDEIKKLYEDVLGLPVLEDNPNFIMFDTKDSRLAFHRLSKGPRLDRPTVELHLEVNDVDEVYRSLQRKGIKFDNKPANMPWGTRMASFRDPEGYEVEIIGPLKESEPQQSD